MHYRHDSHAWEAITDEFLNLLIGNGIHPVQTSIGPRPWFLVLRELRKGSEGLAGS
jgi:hypothetical protein